AESRSAGRPEELEVAVVQRFAASHQRVRVERRLSLPRGEKAVVGLWIASDRAGHEVGGQEAPRRERLVEIHVALPVAREGGGSLGQRGEVPAHGEAARRVVGRY